MYWGKICIILMMRLRVAWKNEFQPVKHELSGCNKGRFLLSLVYSLVECVRMLLLL